MSLVEIAEDEAELVESYDQGEDLTSVVSRNNIEELREFLQQSDPDLDLNVYTRQGLSLVHLAARNNNLEIVKELVKRGINIHSIDDKCETVLHAAAEAGASSVLVKYLLQHKVEINFQNKKGNSALHCAVEQGHLEVAEVLCGDACCKLNLRNKDGESPLTLAVVRGKVDIVKILLDHKVDLNGDDKDGLTPLHHAIMRHQTTIALMLINTGAHVNKPDRDHNTPLHLATGQALLSVVQALCAYGCRADTYNAAGLTALQVGARLGHTDVVRCLLLAGASPFLPSRDNVYPDIMAYARGHKQTGQLLHTMTPERRAVCIEQLIPADRQIQRVKLKILGSTRSGKTCLIEALKTGYFRGVFSNRFQKSLELFGATSNSSHDSTSSSNGVMMTLQDRSRLTQSNNDIRYEVDHENYTRGIEVQTIHISGAGGSGELSVWEFGGYEPYLCTYDHFLGDVNCIHIIAVNLTEPLEVIRYKMRFWLEFLAARLSYKEPLFDLYTKHTKSTNKNHLSSLGAACVAKVLVVGTHCNVIGGERTSAGLVQNQPIITMFEQLQSDLQLNLDIHQDLVFVDSTEKSSLEIKHLRNVLIQYRSEIVARLPSSNLLVDTTASKIHELIPNQDFPCVSWQQFVERVRAKINPLCNEDHLKDLIQQLQYMGELIYLDTDSEPDIIVLSPNWLCSDVIGYLLSFDNISSARVTGSFTRDELEVMLGVREPDSFLRLLAALELCVEVPPPSNQDDDEMTVQYEMPCLNFLEPPNLDQLTNDGGRWIGLQILMPSGGHAAHMMPRIQAQLRQSVVEQDEEGPCAVLDQWFRGSLLSCTDPDIAVLLTMENQARVIEVKGFCASASKTHDCVLVMFGFFQDTINVVLQTIREMSGSLDYEIFCMGNINKDTLKSRKFELYSQGEVARAILETGCTESLADLKSESLREALFLNEESAALQLRPGPSLHVSNLRPPALRRLCRLLDPPDPNGRDWCLLGLQLGLEKALIARLDSATSPTAAILAAWMARVGSEASMQQLIQACEAVERRDVALLLTAAIPLYQFVPNLPDPQIQLSSS